MHDLFGILHLHTAHNVIHLLLGIAGIWAAARRETAVLYAQIGGLAYLLLGAVGFFAPGMFGLMQVDVSDNIVHLVLGAIGTYIGFVMNTNQLAVHKKTA